jgi:hypothetical protein
MALVPLGTLSPAHNRRARSGAAFTRACVQPGNVGRRAVAAPVAEAAHKTWLSVCSPLAPSVVVTVDVAAVAAVTPSLAPCTATSPLCLVRGRRCVVFTHLWVLSLFRRVGFGTWPCVAHRQQRGLTGTLLEP